MITKLLNYFFINSIIVAFMAFIQYFNSHQFWNAFTIGMVFNILVVLFLFLYKKKQLQTKSNP